MLILSTVNRFYPLRQGLANFIEEADCKNLGFGGPDSKLENIYYKFYLKSNMKIGSKFKKV